jgi:RNA polymerase sigma-70 factor (ECF subfamily)
MEKNERLAKNFEQARKHLNNVAYQMLGSTAEAEDAVQEAWIRLSRSESEPIENLQGWLTTVVARICLDLLRSRKSKRSESLDDFSETLSDEGNDFESGLMEKDAVGPALLLILDLLTPTERIAFVLHDIFDLPFDQIAPIIGRNEEATRQLASRARRRLKGGNITQDKERQQNVVSAFLEASRNGNFEALLKILNPDVVLRADETAIKISEANKAKGAPQFQPKISGATTVANTFKGKATAAQLALINGHAGAAWAPGGKPVVIFAFTVVEGKISAIDVVMDPQKLQGFEVVVVGA